MITSTWWLAPVTTWSAPGAVPHHMSHVTVQTGEQVGDPRNVERRAWVGRLDQDRVAYRDRQLSAQVGALVVSLPISGHGLTTPLHIFVISFCLLLQGLLT